MVDTENFDEVEDNEEVHVDGQDTPLCLECMKPVDPNSYYCANCGGASGGLTQYIPYVNIRWSVNWGAKLCRQFWSRDVSKFGRLIRLFVIILIWPLLLVLLPFMKSGKSDEGITDDEQGE